MKRNPDEDHAFRHDVDDRPEKRAKPKHPTLAVVMKGWPRLSETFIAQELALLADSGIEFDIWALRHPYDSKTHALHNQVSADVKYLPEYLKDAPWRVLKGFVWAITRRKFWRVLAVWARDFARDPTSNRARRLGQAMVLARELPSFTKALYVHFMHTPASAARYAANIRGIPWAFSAHAKDIWTIPDWEKREKIADAEFGTTCTAFGAAELRRLARDPKKILLVYHGLELSRFPSPPVREVKNSFPFNLLSVGRLVEKKGFDRLIDALGLLPRNFDWRWVHIGGGELADMLAERAIAANVNHRITWRGPCDQSEVLAAMRAADLFVLPSRIAASGDRDGLPNVLMEAASQKLPILSTPVSAIPEFIENNIHGVLSDDEPAALMNALCALAEDPQRRHSLANAAYERLLSDFTARQGMRILTPKIAALINTSN